MNWHLALEHQMDMHKWHLSDLGRNLTSAFLWSLMYSGWSQMGEEEYADFSYENPQVRDLCAKYADDVVSCLYQGDTVYLTREMQHVILQAAHDLPDERLYLDMHTVLCKTGFMLFEEPIEGEDVNRVVTKVSAIAWKWHPHYIVRTVDDSEPEYGTEVMNLYFFSPDDDFYSEKIATDLREHGIAPPPLQLSHYYPLLPQGGNDRLDLTNLEGASGPGFDLVKALLKFWIATQIISQQRIGLVESTPPPRATRKRASNWDQDRTRYISLIQLRKKKKAKHNEEPKPVDWAYRWMVTGHWRKQWYPSLGRHEWVYIYEYVKGPEDKPLRIRERRVFNFAR